MTQTFDAPAASPPAAPPATDRAQDPDRLRAAIAQTYGRAAAPTAGAALAGYTAAQLGTLPAGVAEDFHGCGNPLAYAEVRSGQTVLDLGSGAGLDLILAGQAVGPTGRVIGVDMTGPMLERARQNVARAGLTNVEVREGLIEALPVDDASIDWVVSNCVVSLSPEKQRVFDEVARVLRPGGRMVISDIVVDDRLAWILARLTRIAPSVALGRPEAVYLDAMARAGLRDVEIRSRFVYEPDHLVGLFGDAGSTTTASTCPVASWRDRVTGSAAGRAAVRLLARQVAGHVWSSRFVARRPSTATP